jgi:hypothetical protein
MTESPVSDDNVPFIIFAMKVEGLTGIFAYDALLTVGLAWTIDVPIRVYTGPEGRECLQSVLASFKVVDAIRGCSNYQRLQ